MVFPRFITAYISIPRENKSLAVSQLIVKTYSGARYSNFGWADAGRSELHSFIGKLALTGKYKEKYV